MQPILLSDCTIKDCLQESNVEQLRQYIKWMKSHQNYLGQNTSRKSDMIAVIQRQLTVDYCCAVWSNMDALQKSAVGEALYHPERRFDPVQFEAKYGKLPETKGGRYGEDVVLPLRLFLYSRNRYRLYPLLVPKDLSDVLFQFVPKPPDARLKSTSELPDVVQRRTFVHYFLDEDETIPLELTRREMEYAALQDLFSVLKLIDQGKISVGAATHLPTAASVRRVSAALFDGDYFDPEAQSPDWDQGVASIRAFAWPLLVLAGGLAVQRNSKLILTKAGRAITQSSAADTLAELWAEWLSNIDFDEFSRIDAIKGQFRGRGKKAMTLPMARRRNIQEALQDCPVGEWVHVDDFSRFMRATCRMFQITDEPWTLYLVDSNYGCFYDHSWQHLQGRYILCLLFEYIATLGLVDVAYTHPKNAKPDFRDLWGADEFEWLSDYDGLEYFRITPLGAYCLGLEKEYTPPVVSDRTRISVLPSKLIKIHSSLTTAERMILDRYANEETETTWRLSVEKMAIAIESGHDINTLRDFLTERDDQPLPEVVDGLLCKIEKNTDVITMAGNALIMECASANVAKELIASTHVAKLCFAAGSKNLIVPVEKEKAFRKAINMLGYNVRMK